MDVFGSQLLLCCHLSLSPHWIKEEEEEKKKKCGSGNRTETPLQVHGKRNFTLLWGFPHSARSSFWYSKEGSRLVCEKQRFSISESQATGSFTWTLNEGRCERVGPQEKAAADWRLADTLVESSDSGTGAEFNADMQRAVQKLTETSNSKYCEDYWRNHCKRTNTSWGQNADCWCSTGGTLPTVLRRVKGNDRKRNGKVPRSITTVQAGMEI